MEQTGSDVRPDISCPEDLPAEEGATMTCTLTADGLEGEYDVEITVTGVDGSDTLFDIQVADQPN